MMPNRNVVLIILVLSIAALFFLFKSEGVGNENLNNNVVNIKPQASTENASKSIDKPISSYPSQKKSMPDNVKIKVVESLNKIELWQKENGFYNEELLTEYRSYNDETLFSLVKNGDQIAIEVLAQRKLDDNKYEDASMLYVDAAIRGSTAALQQLSKISDRLYVQAIAKGDLDSANKYAIDFSAWNMVYRKRGINPFIGELPDPPIRKFLNDAEGKELVNKAASEYYNKLEQERIRLGLNKFENNSDEIRKLYLDLIDIEKTYESPFGYAEGE